MWLKLLGLTLISLTAAIGHGAPTSIGDRGANAGERFAQIRDFVVSPSKYLHSINADVGINARMADAFDGNVRFAVLDNPTHQFYVSSGYKIKDISVENVDSGVSITVAYEPIIKPEKQPNDSPPADPTNTVVIPRRLYQ